MISILQGYGNEYDEIYNFHTNDIFLHNVWLLEYTLSWKLFRDNEKRKIFCYDLKIFREIIMKMHMKIILVKHSAWKWGIYSQIKSFVNSASYLNFQIYQWEKRHLYLDRVALVVETHPGTHVHPKIDHLGFWQLNKVTYVQVLVPTI